LKRYPRAVFIGSAAALLTVGMVAAGIAYAAPGDAATVRVTITAPDGIPASVVLSAKSTYVAVKPKAGTSTTVTIPVIAGSYRVGAEPMTIDGRFYVPTSSRPQVPVNAGRAAELKVDYTRDDSLRDFHAAAIDAKLIKLTWTAKPQFTMTVRRTTGFAPAKAPDQGISVPVSNGTATDTSVQPGAHYTYALFAQYRGKWVGPMVLRLGAASPQPGEATYVANQQTRILRSEDLTSAEPTGSGVRAVLTPGQPVPVIGAAVVLPVSPSLPGGFLGVVTALASDARTVDLAAGGMTDAFDYYELSVPEIHGGDPVPDVAPSGAKSAAPQANAKVAPSGAPVAPGDRKPLAESSDQAAPSGTASAPNAKAGAAKSSAAKVLSCFAGGGGGSADISFAPALALSGHFAATISKYSVLGKDIPTGASLDMSLAATLSGAMTVKTSGKLSCNPGLDPVLVPIAQTPVPMSFYFNPTAEMTVGGEVEIKNLGVAVTAGVKVSGHFGLTNGASFSGSPIFSAVPLTPSVIASGAVGAKVGGQVIVGPGAGTKGAGVIAGLGGEFNPLDASFGPVFPVGDPRFNACLRASAAFTRSLSLTAKAWVGGWEASASATVDALKGESHYPGSPWYFPSGCKDAVEPGDTVIGGGLTKVDDSVTGGGNQWGYVPGFIPGKKSWVLSTGDIAAAVGEPSAFASTDLGGSGDADLTTLAGRPTYDAVTYSATVIPTGSTLHVRYIFASEEYPEFVGSAFNDVMAVYVNGVNCATVPGTNDPVSINTINAGENSAYFVDNSAGASGLGTTMDGLTTPLECKAPVTIGKPITVKITVADASDRIYDSAVALLDQGIWSD
jgi:hypothetical protein